MKKILSEFKEFIMRGNVMDLAVGVIIGTAFKSIVDSLTADIISPILGAFGEVDFSDKILTIGKITLKYGSFITAIINFLIMAAVVFLFVKSVNHIMSLGKKFIPEEEVAPATKKCPYCCSEIDIKASKCPHCTSDID